MIAIKKKCKPRITIEQKFDAIGIMKIDGIVSLKIICIQIYGLFSVNVIEFVN